MCAVELPSIMVLPSKQRVQLMLDAVVDYLPSPLDVPSIKGVDPNTDLRSRTSFI